MNTPSLTGDAIEHIIRLPRPAPLVLAVGAWFNNTLCLAFGNEARISKSVGHLNTPEACREHEHIARQLLSLLGEKAYAIAHDLHPDFHSTRFAARLAAELGVPLIAVQHHHAHIAAVCAEHQLNQPVLGLALDGIGLGTDATAWGGELLKVHGAVCERIGHLRPLALPGADRAAHEPWRMAAAALHEMGHNKIITQRFADQPAAATVASMLQRNLNCPQTSSMGRLFDAAAGLLGLCAIMEFDAQAAITLEQAATRHISTHGLPSALDQGWTITADGQLDLLPTLAYLTDEKNVELGAAVFHSTLITALTDWVQRAAQQTGINTIVCGGGCFFNKILTSGLRAQLESAGLTMLTPQLLAPGDTAIALGQAWVVTQHFYSATSFITAQV